MKWIVIYYLGNQYNGNSAFEYQGPGWGGIGNSTWRPISHVLPSVLNGKSSVYFRFNLGSNANLQYSGLVRKLLCLVYFIILCLSFFSIHQKKAIDDFKIMTNEAGSTTGSFITTGAYMPSGAIYYQGFESNK